jgi:hypothetical protein
MSSSARLSQSPNRLLGIVVGIILLLVGLLGFFVATPYPFATPQGGVVIGLFASNGLLASIHVVLGAVLLICALSAAVASKVANLVVGAITLVLGVFGLFGDHTAANIFALNGGDNLLHVIVAVLLLMVGYATDKLIKPRVAQ